MTKRNKQAFFDHLKNHQKFVSSNVLNIIVHGNIFWDNISSFKMHYPDRSTDGNYSHKRGRKKNNFGGVFYMETTYNMIKTYKKWILHDIGNLMINR